MTDTGSVDIHSEAFARRLANLLAQQRRQRGTTLRKLARTSGRAFTAGELQAFEEARAAIDAERLDAVAALYGADIDAILADRLPLEIRPVGVLTAGGIATAFTPGDDASLLTSYLRLVRQLRSAERAPEVELRREDVEILADHLGDTGESIIDRLGALMGATVAQRRAMAGLFISGALVIGLAGGSVAAFGGGGGAGGGTTSATEPAARSTVTTIVVDSGAPPVTTDVTWQQGDRADLPASAVTVVRDGESGGAPLAVAPTAAPATSDPATGDTAATDPETTETAASGRGTSVAPVTTYPDDPVESEDGTVAVVIPPVPASTGLDAADAAEDELGIADITDDEDLTDLFDEDVPVQATPVVTPDDSGVVDVGTAPAPPAPRGEVETDLPPVP